MTFADLLPGESVFLDANTLVYHVTSHTAFGAACTQLVQRIENQELFGFTSTHVLGEVSHRLMTIQASALLGWPFAGIGNRLRTHPAEVQKLTAFRQAIDQILQSNIQVLPIPPTLLAVAAALCQHIGLLTNDGLVVAVMQSNGLTKPVLELLAASERAKLADVEAKLEAVAKEVEDLELRLFPRETGKPAGASEKTKGCRKKCSMRST